MSTHGRGGIRRGTSCGRDRRDPGAHAAAADGADDERSRPRPRDHAVRGNQGTQYYEVPLDVDVGQGEWTVLIWCQTFGVPVANATPV